MKILASVILVLLAVTCSNKSTSDKGVPTQREVNESMQDINRQFVRDEEEMIEAYIKRRGWHTTATGTGIHYYIYEEGDGPKAEEGMYATVDYEVSLLSGEVIYTSEETGPKEFLIGRDNVESGIHEAIQLMRVGDKAKIVLSSHRAHGLAGDNHKIPPRSSVVYDLHLLRLRQP